VSDEKAVVLTIVGVLVLILGLTWIIQGNDFFLYKVFAPRYEQVRRQTFEQTKSYRQGMVQELQNMQFAYLKADKDHQEALADLILHRAADVPEETLTPELNAFIHKLRQQKVEAGR